MGCYLMSSLRRWIEAHQLSSSFALSRAALLVLEARALEATRPDAACSLLIAAADGAEGAHDDIRHGGVCEYTPGPSGPLPHTSCCSMLLFLSGCQCQLATPCHQTWFATTVHDAMPCRAAARRQLQGFPRPLPPPAEEHHKLVVAAGSSLPCRGPGGGGGTVVSAVSGVRLHGPWCMLDEGEGFVSLSEGVMLSHVLSGRGPGGSGRSLELYSCRVTSHHI